MTAPASALSPHGAMPVALFISDLHLQESHPKTCAAFFAFMQQHAMATQALYLLGDLFEYWAGDDDLDAPFNRQIVQAIRRVSDAGVAVYWIAGNRDFLIGAGFAEAAGATLLAEPHVATIAGQRIALLHGDAQCTDDVHYIAFRNQVRQPQWQAQFLAQPLAQRHAIIAGLRNDSRTEQSGKTSDIMDVTPLAIAQVFMDTATTLMIHGHTHRPALHAQGALLRYVLPDWDLDTAPERGGWIAVHADGTLHRHDRNGAEIA
jgi:UDP-2,3-diacylglucosamine hydrolase